MKKCTFTVLIEKDEDGMFIASVPALKGCHSQAKTMDELLTRIQETIELCLEVDKEELYLNQFVGVQQVEVQV
ncbi:MAG: type II toxin-antitoxin system HicB family antitoxin [Syntrophomonadaceae bacterium]|nr:type II toxin-antitoxin system HicB family antitoxin [Syntrophomonadaceae bacterium]MDD3889307.1 type II toxin-antitoxin system HicB family antitoxin [Syntrophomonadaceae bacterium]MDD4549868.1 type II toxin-antitoxin system HicB family antitoxin [Syntrophomonadaceae bacterium]